MKLDVQDFAKIEESLKKNKEYKLLGDFLPSIDGGKLYEFNMTTHILSEVEVIKTDTLDLATGNATRKIHTNKNCVYLEALNLQNARKRLLKGKILFSS